MKTLLLTILAGTVLTLAASAAPNLPIDKAVALAQTRLKERGLEGKYFITSITLEPDTITRGAFHWYAKWNASIPIEGTKTELGLEITMDGTVVSIVNKTKADGSASGGGNALFGSGSTGDLSNHRRRSDRPSILDLKH